MSSETKEKVPNIASYELLGKLARGGMGTVYLARRAGQAGFQRLFAVKVIHEHLADSEECVEMFLDEARLSARLHHSNVVPVVDVGAADGRHYVVMDYIEGTSLGYLLKKSPDDRPAGIIAKLFSDFLEGLHAAHELSDDEGKPLKMVHRDVSPPNVLVGVDGVGRISDFGIAKAEARLSSTRTGLRKGKLAFMAPEQLLDEPVDRRTDIFAAGVTLWTALSGEQLFRGTNDAATINNLLSREVPKPSEGRLAPPEAFDAVCLRAMQRNPDDRYETAHEMAEDLREAIREAGLKTSAHEVSGWVKSVAGPTLERRKVMLAKALAPEPDADESSLPSVGETAHGTGSGGASAGVESKRTQLTSTSDNDEPAASSEDEKERRTPILMLGAAALLLGGIVAVVSLAGRDDSAQAARVDSGRIDGSSDPTDEADFPVEAAPSGPKPSAPPDDGGESDTAEADGADADEADADEDMAEDDTADDAEADATPPTAVQPRRPMYRGSTRLPPPSKPSTNPSKPSNGDEDQGKVYEDVAPEASAPKPSSAPKPAPKGGDDVVVERNPYLRGKK